MNLAFQFMMIGDCYVSIKLKTVPFVSNIKVMYLSNINKHNTSLIIISQCKREVTGNVRRQMERVFVNEFLIS